MRQMFIIRQLSGRALNVDSVDAIHTNFGELAERPKAAVLKTVEEKSSGGSNPSLSAISKSPFKWGFFYGGERGLRDFLPVIEKKYL